MAFYLLKLPDAFVYAAAGVTHIGRHNCKHTVAHGREGGVDDAYLSIGMLRCYELRGLHGARPCSGYAAAQRDVQYGLFLLKQRRPELCEIIWRDLTCLCQRAVSHFLIEDLQVGRVHGIEVIFAVKGVAH